VAKAKELKKQFSEIEKTLYQTKNRSVQDPLNYPIRLTNKLGHLNSLVTMDDFPPTEQDKAVKKELTQKINQELEKFNNLSSQEIEKFNASFNELKLNYLNIEK
jgi:Ni,Fe-hydrogenase maturation factor